MNTTTSQQPVRRRLLWLMSLWPWTVGCSEKASATDAAGGASADPQRRFRGIGVVLVVDAVPGVEMEGVIFYDDEAVRIFSSSMVAKRIRAIMALGGARVPLTVRVMWRDDPKPIWGKDGGIDNEGTILGDYTVPIAERIPDAVLKDIHAKGGALRLKFRLKPDGVLFGWDIERPGGGISKFDMPGGDFLDTRY